MERPKRRSANMTTDHEFAVVASTTDVQKVFVAIELSKSTWVVAIQPPAVDKVSLFRIAGGEIERLFELFEQARRRAGQQTDRTDAESLVRVLMAIYRGEHQ